ncbi:MAG: C39 family peptidase [Oscillospiraceae bacterium]|nr:C39 family peptidase [Oscillospiraceae bacterium]
MLKKFTSLFLATVFISALLIIPVSANSIITIDDLAEQIANEYKSMYPDKSIIIDEVINLLINDVEFIYTFNKNPDDAYDLTERMLNDSLFTPIIPLGNHLSSWFYADYTVPYVNQILNYYCGPASIAQALIGNGTQLNTTSNKNRAFLDARAADMGTTQSDGTHLQDMKWMMNHYYANGNTYKDSIVTVYNIDTAMGRLENSLAKGYVPIIYLADTNLLSYYNSTFKHYVVIYDINHVTNKVKLMDPHWLSAHGGVREISIPEFRDAISANTVNGNSWILYN